MNWGDVIPGQLVTVSGRPAVVIGVADFPPDDPLWDDIAAVSRDNRLAVWVRTGRSRVTLLTPRRDDPVSLLA